MLFNQNNISRLGKCNTMFGGVNKQAFVNLLLDTSFLQLSPGLFTIYHRLFRFCSSFPIVLFFFLYGKYMPCLSHNMLNNTALFPMKNCDLTIFILIYIHCLYSHMHIAYIHVKFQIAFCYCHLLSIAINDQFYSLKSYCFIGEDRQV